VDKAAINVTTAFVNGTGTMTLAIGTTSSVTAFFSATSLTTAGLYTAANGLNSVTTPADSKGTATRNMLATITATGVAPVSATAGSVDIYLSVVDQTKLG
jgi:hypothetical protein